MKKVYYLILFTLMSPACKKNDCQTCTQVVVGPDMQGGISRDTIYTNQQYCGDGLDEEKKKNGKYTEYSQGGNVYRWTTTVSCH